MENANEAIYLGVYTFMFVMALSLTIFLFSSLMTYTDNAYAYMHQATNDGVNITGGENRHLLLSGQEVISYYYNYIKKDNYTDKTVYPETVVTINTHTKSEAELLLDDVDLSYKDVVERIGMENQYILTVGENTTDDVTYINIIKATPEELEEMW